jgi:choline dehydrogenase
MMTAEKAADLILGNTPLPAEPVPFFRRDRTQVEVGESLPRSEE